MFPKLSIADVFVALSLGSGNEADVIEAAKGSSGANVVDNNSFMNRANYGHVLPLFVMLILLVIMEILNFLFTYIIPLSAILGFLRSSSITQTYFNCCGERYKRNIKPAFSECYAVPFRTNQSIESANLSDLEIRIGYEKRYFGEEGRQKLSKVKLRRDPKTNKKMFERTWEVIKDTTGQYSYNIRANPVYGAHLK
eukprot:g9003.t1